MQRVPALSGAVSMRIKMTCEKYRIEIFGISETDGNGRAVTGKMCQSYASDGNCIYKRDALTDCCYPKEEMIRTESPAAQPPKPSAEEIRNNLLC